MVAALKVFCSVYVPTEHKTEVSAVRNTGDKREKREDAYRLTPPMSAMNSQVKRSPLFRNRKCKNPLTLEILTPGCFLPPPEVAAPAWYF